MTNTLIVNTLPITSARSNGKNHLHFDSDKTWLERDKCAHQDLITIQCAGTPEDIGLKRKPQQEFICGFCGVGANPDIKPEPRTDEWYRGMEQRV